MASSYRDWAWLPRNLLHSILDKLVQFSDYVYFAAVCQQWRHYALEDTDESSNHDRDVDHDYKQSLRILKACHNMLPMLMIQTEKTHESEKRLLFSVTQGITYQVKLPLPCNNRFFGSSFGWLFTTEGKSMDIALLNPFFNGIVRLPPFKDPSGEFEYFTDDIPDYFIQKGILSSDPFLSRNDYEALVIYGGMCRLAFVKPGQDSWHFLDHINQHFVFSDVIYHKGRVHAVNDWSQLVQIGLTDGTVKVMTKRSHDCAHAAYLVESQEGDLLLVERFWFPPYNEDNDNENSEEEDLKTYKFGVFKLVMRSVTGEEREEEGEWVEMKRLGEQALFLGDNHSVSVSTLEFPDQCLPNCIYYTDQRHGGHPPYTCHGLDDDSGVFNLEDGSFRSFRFEKQTLPPIWLVPNLKGE